MTRQDAIVTINLGDAAGERQLTFADVQQFIHSFIQATQYSEAASVSMQLADQLPEDAWPHLVAAESLYLQQQIEPAFRYIDRALEIDPRNLASLVIKSRLCLYSGRHADAMQLIDDAISLAPNNARLHFEKGEILAEAGDLEGARAAYRRSVDLDVRNADGLLGLSRLPGDDVSDDLINTVEVLLQSRHLPAEEQIKAHFALAHAYGGKSNVAPQFAHLKAGNELKYRSLSYDPDAATQEAQRTIDYFSEDFFVRQGGVHGNSANIIFIVGFPRCGSTLVEQILSNHPLVSAAGETFALRSAIRDFQQSGDLWSRYPYWIESQTDRALNEIADDYVRRVEQFNRSAYLTDKLLNNFMYVGLITLMFPNARIVNVQRNPIDVCYSCYKNLFSGSSLPFTYNLEALARKYRDYRRVIRHWNNVLPGAMHTVEYEELVNRQEHVTRELLEYCRLPWADDCLDFQQNARTVLTASNIQVRQPLYTTSIDLWKGYADYLGPLLELTND